jgi:hypothetical protein
MNYAFLKIEFLFFGWRGTGMDQYPERGNASVVT